MRLTPFILSQNLSIDNALSTIQVIHQLITQVNKVVEYVNQIDITANDYTDEQINKLKTEINQLEKDLKSYTDVALDTSKTYTDDALDTAKTYTDSAFNELKDKVIDDVSNIYRSISNLDASLKIFVTNEDSKLKVALDEAYNSLVKLINEGNTLVNSPVDGRSKSIQQALNDIFNIINIDTGCINLKFAKKMFSNALSVPGPDNTNLYFGNITIASFKQSTYFTSSSVYLTFKNLLGSDAQNQNFILHNRLDCIRRYAFEFLYLVTLCYIMGFGITQIDATAKLNTVLYAALGVGYGSPINTHAWDHI